MEDFVSFEIAKKLKEKEFTCEYPFAMYNKYEEFCPLYSSDKFYFGIDDFDKHAYIAPTISQVLKWLRDEKKIHIGVLYHNYYAVWIQPMKRNESEHVIHDCKTHEGAAIAGIEYVLDNLI